MAEQVQTDRAAWEGEMFRLLAENVKDYAIFIVDLHRHVLSWSKGAERLLGFSEQEIIGRQCDCFFTPEDVERDIPQKELEQALATGRGEDDRWHMRKDGTRFWASGAVTPLKDEGGRLRGFAKIMRDRTEMKLAEEAAFERQRQLQLLTDQAPVLIAHCDTERRYKFVNKPYAARFGLHPREVVGRPIRDVLGGPAYAAIERHVDAALGGERVEFEAEVAYGDKGPQVMRCAYDPEFDAEGRVQGFVAAIVNVTEGRRTREELRESEERLRTLSDNLPSGAVYQVVGDREGRRRYLYVSAGIERLFGVTPAEAMADANALYALVHEEDRSRVTATEAVALRDSSPFDCEFRSWTRSGGLIWVHCRSAPHRLTSGETVWEGIVLDVTDRKRAEEELREADRRKDEFLAMLSHELRNPLAPILNSLHIMRQVVSESPVLQQVRATIERQVQQMARLVDDLLDVSRITQGKLQLRKERVELRAVIDRAVEVVRPLIETHRHELAVSLPATPVWLEADPARLGQVLTNLLNNAAKYTEAGGYISLEATVQADAAVLKVRDNGVGIAPEALPRVFDLFAQADRSQARSQGGLGVGLTLVKRLAELHGGTVEAASAGLGRGSEFTVRLPVLLTVAGDSTEAVETSRHNARPLHVLAVDDNVDAADSLAMLLRLSGHEVQVAHNGLKALELAGAYLPDVVLLDIGLPGLDGFQVAERLRRLPDADKVVLVALTGYGQEADRQRSQAAGFDHHLVKPVDPRRLQELLASFETPERRGARP